MSAIAATIDSTRRLPVPPPAGSATSLAHGYIWIWLAIFALPFVATTIHSLELPDGGYGFDAYQYVLGSASRTTSDSRSR